MVEIEGTERVVMNWPVDLKKRVREMAGDRGMTEFIIKATSIYLEEDASFIQLEQQLDENRHFTQLLADQLVLGGDSDERLQFLMELDFPDWISTQGWPEAYAERVRPHKEAREEILGGGPVVEVTRIVPPKERRDDHPVPVDPPTPSEVDSFVALAEQPLAEKKPAVVKKVKVARPPQIRAPLVEKPAVAKPAPAVGDDLFSRLKASGKLKVASDLPKPDPVVMKDLCPTCNEELIDGECWTCAS